MPRKIDAVLFNIDESVEKVSDFVDYDNNSNDNNNNYNTHASEQNGSDAGEKILTKRALCSQGINQTL